ncbi:expressed protein [Phakopsora pachyrhizi]|uniref:Expressed protein n=1 Tax=Phakopsora pachyrhizi TaxID=170000 RepID=A0AAV0BI61_PHAPC|nr:expressed protein [Phakopsora pachyrhizi]
MDRIHPCRIPSNVGCKLKNAINCSLSVLPSGSQQPSSKPHSSSLRPHINSLSSTAVSESSKLLHGSWNKTQQSNVATFGKPVSESILLNEAAAAQQNVDGHQVASPINPKTNVPTFCEYVNGQWVLSDNWNLYGVSGPAQRHRPRSLIEDNAPINPANHLNSSSLAVAHHAALTGEMLPLYEISPLNTGSQVSNSTNNGTKLYLPAGWNHTSPRGPLYVVPAIVTSSLFLALSVVGTVVFLVARRRAARNRARKASITQRDGDRSRDLSFKDEESAVEMLEDRVSHRRHQASQRLKTLTIIKILRKAGGKREARVKRLSTAAISTNSPSVILIEEAPLNSRALPSVWNTNRTTRRRTSRWSLPRAHLREDQNIHTLQSDTMPGSSDSPILPESEGNRELVSTPLDNSHNVDFQNARSENIQDPECPSISNSLASISRNNLLPNSSSSMPISGLRLVGDNDRPGHQPQPSSNTVGHQNTSRESVSPGPPCTSLSRSRLL